MTIVLTVAFAGTVFAATKLKEPKKTNVKPLKKAYDHE
jgi:hypothetical protein